MQQQIARLIEVRALIETHPLYSSRPNEEQTTPYTDKSNNAYMQSCNALKYL